MAALDVAQHRAQLLVDLVVRLLRRHRRCRHCGQRGDPSRGLLSSRSPRGFAVSVVYRSKENCARARRPRVTPVD
jgi:hypothetical protein